MELAPVTIARRYRGPRTSANGGYAAGLLAGALGAGAAEVTLRLPPPLDRPLELRREGERMLMLDAEVLVAEARPADPGLVPPPPPSWDEAVAAARAAGGWGAPAFDECFVCGVRPDGLEIHAGRVESRPPLVAATWVAHEVAPEIVWAAIDCPGAYALRGEGRGEPLLARITARLDRLPQEGERCVVVGWPLDEDGRKRHAGTALYGEDGEPLAVSAQLWIAPRPPR
ncbi:hypothetical protein Gocc_0174 [Gaiella occulta]|uniref:Thioesterase-like superfamily n=1 Tax=Gaiella occulta TaxID=1002870 RepID=A0A7M2Z151_9ACTN|nr:hypothetical protein [Gaiella occulta]RDI75755.1 hypothetical protein Gocc_0174 [Gaiella occulta]